MKIAVIMGSVSDFDSLREMVDFLRSMDVSVDIRALSAHPSYHGVDATVEVSPSVTPDGSLLLSATTVRVGSQDAVSVSGNAEWLSYVGMDSADKEIAMDFLPQGLALTGAVVTSEGLRLTFEGRDVDLADL